MNALSISSRQRRLRGLTLVLMVAFLAVALVLVLWSVIRAGVLAQRADNPRLVESELRIRRGNIWDSRNTLIAETTGPAENPQRAYLPATVGPAIGYYSFRHGTVGVEAGYDAVLRGDSADEWVNLAREQLHLLQTGRDIRVTLDARHQRIADALLGDRHGAVVLLSVPDGAIRVMVSHPDYDPNTLDEQFDALVSDADAPLLNRAAQSQYQPGMALQPLLIAAALDEGLIALDDVVADVELPVAVNGQLSGCAGSPGGEQASWAQVLRARCPAPMQQLGEQLGARWLDQAFDAFGLTRTPVLPIDTETPPVQPTSDALMAAIGQENLVVTPLQMAVALAGLVNDGNLPVLQLVTAVQNENGDWVSEPQAMAGTRAIGSAAGRQVSAALPLVGNVISEHAASAFSGPEGRTIGWYLAAAPAATPRYVVVVVVEDDTAALAATRVGRSLMDNILRAE